MSRNKVSEKVQKVIIDLLRQGTIPWSSPVDMGKAVSWVTGKAYKGVNAWILPPGEYLTFSQVKNQGGKVKKGSKSHTAIYWNVVDSRTETEQRVIDGVTREVPKKLYIMRYFNLFEVSQCEGISYKHNKESYYANEESSKDTRELEEQLQKAERIINTFKYKPTYNLERHIKTPCYIPSLDTIEMPRRAMFSSLERYYSTFFHELTHATGSEDRLNRDGVARFKGKLDKRNYSYEELVAEMGASIMGGYLGFSEKIYESNASYIEGWLRALDDDIGMLISASSKANEAFNYILDNSLGSEVATAEEQAIETGNYDEMFLAIKSSKLNNLDNFTTIMVNIYLDNHEKELLETYSEQINGSGKDEATINEIKNLYTQYLNTVISFAKDSTTDLMSGQHKNKKIELFNYLNDGSTQQTLRSLKATEIKDQYNKFREMFDNHLEKLEEETLGDLDEETLAKEYSKQLLELIHEKDVKNQYELIPIILTHIFVHNNSKHLGKLLAIQRLKILNTDVNDLKDKNIPDNIAERTYMGLLDKSDKEYVNLKKDVINESVDVTYVLGKIATKECGEYLKDNKSKSMRVHYDNVRKYLFSEIQKDGIYEDDATINRYIEELRKITLLFVNRAKGLQSEILRIRYLESEQSKYYYEGLIVSEIAMLMKHPREFDSIKKEHIDYLEFERSQIKYEGSIVSHELGQVEQVLVQFVKSEDIREHLNSTEVLTKYTDNRELINYIKELYITKNPSQQYDGENEYEHYLGQLINIAKYYAKTQEHNVIRELFTVMYLREEQAFVYRIYVDEILSYLYLPNEVELVQSVINKFKDKVERFIEELYDYNITKMAQWRVNFMDIEDVLSSQKFKELSKGNMYIRLRDLYADIESLIKARKVNNIELNEQELTRLERFKPLIESYEDLLTRVKTGRSNMDLPLGVQITRLPKSNPVIHVKLSRSNNKGEPILIAFNPREYYLSEGKSYEKKIAIKNESIQYLHVFNAFIQQHVLPLNPNISQLKYLMEMVNRAYDLRRKVE